MKAPDWQEWVKNKKECQAWLEKYIKKGMLKKSRDDSKLHIRKADHNLNLGNWLKEKHSTEMPRIFREETFYDWVINMYYYAIYHAALALISKAGCKSKSHSATLCFLIMNNYHSQKDLEKEEVELVANSLNKQDIETIGFSKELREKASYEVHGSFEAQLAEQTRVDAVSFVNKIKALLDK
jgi:uncharacterized protein (UPF0332 family)